MHARRCQVIHRQRRGVCARDAVVASEMRLEPRRRAKVKTCYEVLGVRYLALEVRELVWGSELAGELTTPTNARCATCYAPAQSNMNEHQV